MLVNFWFSLAKLRNLFQKNCVHSSSTVVLCLKRGVMTFGVLLPLPCAELEVGIWWDVVIQELFKSHSFGMNKNQTTFGFSQKWVFARMGLLAIIEDISRDTSRNFKVDDLFCCLTMVSPCQRRFPETSGLKEVKSAMPIGKQLWCCDKRSYKMSIEQVRGIIHIYIYIYLFFYLFICTYIGVFHK